MCQALVLESFDDVMTPPQELSIDRPKLAESGSPGAGNLAIESRGRQKKKQSDHTSLRRSRQNPTWRFRSPQDIVGHSCETYVSPRLQGYVQVVDKGERPGSRPVIGLDIMAEQSNSSQPLRTPATAPVKNFATTGTNLDTKIHIDTSKDTFPGKKQSLYMGDELSIDDELSTGAEREIVAESGNNQEDYDREEEILESRDDQNSEVFPRLPNSSDHIRPYRPVPTSPMPRERQGP